ncbi:MAG TPA: LysR family transcriptional regulator [Gammaproteobacteria bacterium]|nr:LysR family transcriptional regulator [Gammaproteobacteria bacterium]
MTLKELRYFLALAETGHFGRASERCYVSQSTLSLQLRQLEKTLGLDLFDRGTRPVSLTAAGRQLVPLARVVVMTADQIRVFACEYQANASPSVSTGSDPEGAARPSAGCRL